jgi:hypothetical protein
MEQAVSHCKGARYAAHAIRTAAANVRTAAERVVLTHKVIPLLKMRSHWRHRNHRNRSSRQVAKIKYRVIVYPIQGHWESRRLAGSPSELLSDIHAFYQG